MAETSFFLEICLEGSMHRMAYETMEDAQAEVRAVEDKIGERFSNDPDKAKHKFHAADGSMVVSMSSVIAVRAIDLRSFEDRMAYARERDIDLAKSLRGNATPATTD